MYFFKLSFDLLIISEYFMSKNFLPVEKEQLSTWQLLSQFRYMHESLACLPAGAQSTEIDVTII
jgi:hypothetical protein